MTIGKMFCSAVLEPKGPPPNVVSWRKRSDFVRSHSMMNGVIASDEDAKLPKGTYDISHTSGRNPKSPFEFNPDDDFVDVAVNKQAPTRGTPLDLPEESHSMLPILNKTNSAPQSKSSLRERGTDKLDCSFLATSISRDEPVTTSDLFELLPVNHSGRADVKRAPRIARPSRPPTRRDVVNGTLGL